MASRLKLQTELENILGSKEVYFQPPSSGMVYPAIKYSLGKPDTRYANDSTYKQMKAYEVIVMDYDPDSSIAEAVSKLPYCSFTTMYPVNNLNHFVYTLYY